MPNRHHRQSIDHRPFVVTVELSSPIRLASPYYLMLDGLLFSLAHGRNPDAYARILTRFGGRRPGDWIVCASASTIDPPLPPHGPGAVITHAAASLTFHGHGNVDRVDELLSDLTNVGRDANEGFGAVADAVIEPCDDDRSLVWQGVAMRPIPTRLSMAWERAEDLAWRVPYWDGATVEPCVPPGASVRLPSWMGPL